MTDITQRLQIRYPIIQAPMAGVSTPELAAAVSNAGGLGSIALGASTAEQAREMFRKTKALTDRPFNANLFCHAPVVPDRARERAWIEYLAPHFAEFEATPPASLREIYTSFVADEAMLAVLLEQRPAVVSFHFGLPRASWIQRLREAGIFTLACATTPVEAAQCEHAGVDAIVAQGVEAGGHRGVFDPRKVDDEIGTMALVRMLSVQCRVPVIAAGGIMDGIGIAAAMSLGASAVQMGTAFILCPETAASAAFRSQLKSERAHHTRITAAISGRAARGISNRMYALSEDSHAPALPDYPIAYDAAKALHAIASAKGNHEYAAHWAGQGAPLARELPAAELIEQLIAEWRQSESFCSEASRVR
jgi:nitronate monooxygenase